MPVIAHNIASQFTNRQLNITTGKKTKSAEKLSSGYKINRSADDAAGLSISEKMRSQIRGLNQASRNIQDGVSLCQVADGALNETTAVLQRMRELSIQSANGTNGESDRQALQEEIDQLTKEVDRIAGATSFNQDIYPLKVQNVSTIVTEVNAIKSIFSDFTFTRQDALRDIIDKSGGEFKAMYGKTFSFSEMKYNSLQIYNNTELSEKYSANLYMHNSRVKGTSIYPDWKNLDAVVKAGEYEQPTQYGYVVKSASPSFNFTLKEDTSVREIYDYLSQCSITISSSGEWIMNFPKDSLTNMVTNIRVNGNIWIQSGANAGEGLVLNLVDATAKGIGITDPNISVMSEEDCDDAMSRLDDAIQTVSSYRSQFGAYQNRLEHAKAVDDNTAENTQYAESRIRDTDMAEEMVEHSKNNILEQVGQSMLAQANQSTQGILSLLG